MGLEMLWNVSAKGSLCRNQRKHLDRATASQVCRGSSQHPPPIHSPWWSHLLNQKYTGDSESPEPLRMLPSPATSTPFSVKDILKLEKQHPAGQVEATPCSEGQDKGRDTEDLGLPCQSPMGEEDEETQEQSECRDCKLTYYMLANQFTV